MLNHGKNVWRIIYVKMGFNIPDKNVCDRFVSTSSIVTDVGLSDFPACNESILTYAPDSVEHESLREELNEMMGDCEDVPIVIGDDEFRTSHVKFQVMPHNFQHRIAKFHHADAKLVGKAIEVATEAQKRWDLVPVGRKVDIWHRAAHLMATKYRQKLNAATMLGQSKTIIQAEIDAAAELVDFIRFAAFYLKETLKYQPISPDPKTSRNTMHLRGLEGFVAAISPFNFTAIGGNLAYTPALMGCSVVWKPSDTAILSNWWIFKAMREAGVPPGVVNFVPADGPTFGTTITQSIHLSGINFTGSARTFQWLWQEVGKNVANYRNFPRLVGECGGKNYHFVHKSAHIDTVVATTLRSAFEYSGQKCSACSRMYVASSIWPQIKSKMLEMRKTLQVGDPTNFTNFTGAVIDCAAFERIVGFIEYAKESNAVQVLGGGCYDRSKGYFVEPTIIQTQDPMDRTMKEEIFGPVLTVYVYEDEHVEEAVKLVGTTTKFALTGAIFAKDQEFLKRALEEFRMTAGNLYLNDKSTGSVVGQQPFGGGRMSGTNDKAGGPHYILKWTTPQVIKETFTPQLDVFYPNM